MVNTPPSLERGRCAHQAWRVFRSQRYGSPSTDFQRPVSESVPTSSRSSIVVFRRRRRARERFCTRVVIHNVTPSLNVFYKNTRIKQYHKENRALPTETTINNTYDFRNGKHLSNLPKLREIGFAANRRLLEVERISHDCILSEEGPDLIIKCNALRVRLRTCSRVAELSQTLGDGGDFQEREAAGVEIFPSNGALARGATSCKARPSSKITAPHHEKSRCT